MRKNVDSLVTIKFCGEAPIPAKPVGTEMNWRSKKRNESNHSPQKRPHLPTRAAKAAATMSAAKPVEGTAVEAIAAATTSAAKPVEGTETVKAISVATTSVAKPAEVT